MYRELQDQEEDTLQEGREHVLHGCLGEGLRQAIQGQERHGRGSRRREIVGFHPAEQTMTHQSQLISPAFCESGRATDCADPHNQVLAADEGEKDPDDDMGWLDKLQLPSCDAEISGVTN